MVTDRMIWYDENGNPITYLFQALATNVVCDELHRFVSDDDINNWNNKANGNHEHSTVNGYIVECNVPPDAKFTDTTYENATVTNDGLMSKEDKEKLTNLFYFTQEMYDSLVESCITATDEEAYIYLFGEENIPNGQLNTEYINNMTVQYFENKTVSEVEA